MTSPTSSPPQIGIFPDFIAHQDEEIVFTQESLSQFRNKVSIGCVLANSGRPLLRVDGRIQSFSGRRKVTDAAGNHIFDIVKSGLTPTSTLRVFDVNGRELMEVRSSVRLIGSKAIATFTSQSGKVETLEMKGSANDSTAVITDQSRGGAVVASITRKRAGTFYNKLRYTLQVAPGVDMALMIAISFVFTTRRAMM